MANLSTNVMTKPVFRPTLTLSAACLTATVTTTSTIISYTTAMKSHAGPMDLSFASKHRPLSHKERDYCNCLNLCQSYSQDVYFTRNCSKLRAK